MTRAGGGDLKEEEKKEKKGTNCCLRHSSAVSFPLISVSAAGVFSHSQGYFFSHSLSLSLFLPALQEHKATTDSRTSASCHRHFATDVGIALSLLCGVQI